MAAAEAQYDSTVQTANATFLSAKQSAVNQFNQAQQSADASYASAVGTAYKAFQAAMANPNCPVDLASAQQTQQSAVESAVAAYNQAVSANNTQYLAQYEAAAAAFQAELPAPWTGPTGTSAWLAYETTVTDEWMAFNQTTAALEQQQSDLDAAALLTRNQTVDASWQAYSDQVAARNAWIQEYKAQEQEVYQVAVAQAALDCTQAIDLAQDGSSGGMDETIAQAVEQRSATIAGAEATLQDGEAGAELAAVTLWYNQTQGGWRAYPATATPGNIPTQNAWAAYQLAVAQDRDTYVQAAAAANLSQATTIAEAVQTQSVSYAQAEQTRADTIAQQQFDRVAGGGSETGDAPAEETCLAGEISDELTEQQADDLASDQKMDGYAAADQGYSSNVDAATAAQQTAKGNAEGQLSLADDAAFVVETAAWAGWQPPNPGDPQGSQGPNPYQVYEQTCATNQQAYLAALDTGEYHDALAMISALQTRAQLISSATDADAVAEDSALATCLGLSSGSDDDAIGLGSSGSGLGDGTAPSPSGAGTGYSVPSTGYSEPVSSGYTGNADVETEYSEPVSSGYTGNADETNLLTPNSYLLTSSSAYMGPLTPAEIESQSLMSEPHSNPSSDSAYLGAVTEPETDLLTSNSYLLTSSSPGISALEDTYNDTLAADDNAFATATANAYGAEEIAQANADDAEAVSAATAQQTAQDNTAASAYTQQVDDTAAQGTFQVATATSYEASVAAWASTQNTPWSAYLVTLAGDEVTRQTSDAAATNTAAEGTGGATLTQTETDDGADATDADAQAAAAQAKTQGLAAAQEQLANSEAQARMQDRAGGGRPDRRARRGDDGREPDLPGPACRRRADPPEWDRRGRVDLPAHGRLDAVPIDAQRAQRQPVRRRVRRRDGDAVEPGRDGRGDLRRRRGRRPPVLDRRRGQ